MTGFVSTDPPVSSPTEELREFGPERHTRSVYLCHVLPLAPWAKFAQRVRRSKSGDWRGQICSVSPCLRGESVYSRFPSSYHSIISLFQPSTTP